MPTSFTENNYPLEAILSEANGHRSRETVTILSGQNLKAGAVVGIVTASGKYKIADNVTPASDGSQTAKAVLLEDVDASAADKPGLVLRRDAEVKVGALNYMAGASAGNKASLHGHLATEGIIVR